MHHTRAGRERPRRHHDRPLVRQATLDYIKHLRRGGESQLVKSNFGPPQRRDDLEQTNHRLLGRVHDNYEDDDFGTAAEIMRAARRRADDFGRDIEGDLNRLGVDLRCLTQ